MQFAAVHNNSNPNTSSVGDGNDELKNLLITVDVNDSGVCNDSVVTCSVKDDLSKEVEAGAMLPIEIETSPLPLPLPLPAKNTTATATATTTATATIPKLESNLQSRGQRRRSSIDGSITEKLNKRTTGDKFNHSHNDLTIKSPRWSRRRMSLSNEQGSSKNKQSRRNSSSQYDNKDPTTPRGLSSSSRKFQRRTSIDSRRWNNSDSNLGSPRVSTTPVSGGSSSRKQLQQRRNSCNGSSSPRRFNRRCSIEGRQSMKATTTATISTPKKSSYNEKTRVVVENMTKSPSPCLPLITSLNNDDLPQFGFVQDNPKSHPRQSNQQQPLRSSTKKQSSASKKRSKGIHRGTSFLKLVECLGNGDDDGPADGSNAKTNNDDKPKKDNNSSSTKPAHHDNSDFDLNEDPAWSLSGFEKKMLAKGLPLVISYDPNENVQKILDNTSSNKKKKSSNRSSRTKSPKPLDSRTSRSRKRSSSNSHHYRRSTSLNSESFSVTEKRKSKPSKSSSRSLHSSSRSLHSSSKHSRGNRSRSLSRNPNGSSSHSRPMIRSNSESILNSSSSHHNKRKHQKSSTNAPKSTGTTCSKRKLKSLSSMIRSHSDGTLALQDNGKKSLASKSTKSTASISSGTKSSHNSKTSSKNQNPHNKFIRSHSDGHLGEGLTHKIQTKSSSSGRSIIKVSLKGNSIKHDKVRRESKSPIGAKLYTDDSVSNNHSHRSNMLSRSLSDGLLDGSDHVKKHRSKGRRESKSPSRTRTIGGDRARNREINGNGAVKTRNINEGHNRNKLFVRSHSDGLLDESTHKKNNQQYEGSRNSYRSHNQNSERARRESKSPGRARLHKINIDKARTKDPVSSSKRRPSRGGGGGNAQPQLRKSSPKSDGSTMQSPHKSATSKKVHNNKIDNDISKTGSSKPRRQQQPSPQRIDQNKKRMLSDMRKHKSCGDLLGKLDYEDDNGDDDEILSFSSHNIGAQGSLVGSTTLGPRRNSLIL